MRVCNNKDVQKYIKTLTQMGWTIKAGKRHSRLITPDGLRWVSVSSTPHDKGYLRVLKGRINLLESNL